MAGSLTTPVAVFTIATFVKLLLVPAYRSTDFEVHRNWLAITHSLPISKWYYEDTSEWTLDYPPLFAWFEYVLSIFASLIDPTITRIDSLRYSAPSCILFQRLTVAASDLTLLYAVIQYCQHRERSSEDKATASQRTLVLSLLLLLNYGLLVVDHIHFQYNGFLFGILLLSVTRIMQERCLEGAFYFTVLLNFKHIFLYIAPAYFVYLLKHYCFRGNESNKGKSVALSSKPHFLPLNFVKLGVLVLTVFAISFGPFIAMGQLGQVLSRLFPFKRGLCHSYWAPNAWALYNSADIVLAIVASKLGVLPASASSVTGGMTSGLVGEMHHQLLPSIPPWVTLVATLLAMAPALLRLWLKPSSPTHFLHCLILCGYASFLFGWHVHEKAIMMVTLPTCLLAVEHVTHARTFLLLSTTAHISLFPLLFRPAETLLKISLYVACTVATFMSLSLTARKPRENAESSTSSTGTLLFPLLHRSESLYLLLLLVIQTYCLFLHGVGGFMARYQFLPLLSTSLSCSVGVMWSWALCWKDYWSH